MVPRSTQVTYENYTCYRNSFAVAIHEIVRWWEIFLKVLAYYHIKTWVAPDRNIILVSPEGQSVTFVGPNGQIEILSWPIGPAKYWDHLGILAAKAVCREFFEQIWQFPLCYRLENNVSRHGAYSVSNSWFILFSLILLREWYSLNAAYTFGCLFRLD